MAFEEDRKAFKDVRNANASEDDQRTPDVFQGSMTRMENPQLKVAGTTCLIVG